MKNFTTTTVLFLVSCHMLVVPTMAFAYQQPPALFIQTNAVGESSSSSTRYRHHGSLTWRQEMNRFTSRRTTALCSSSTTTPTSVPPPPQTTTSNLGLENDVILYDGVCNFCNTWVDILLRIDRQGKFRFAPLQSQVGQSLLVAIGKEANDISSVVLVKKTTGQQSTTTGSNNDDGLVFFDKSRCVLQVVRELGPVAALASQTALRLVPESIRDSIYDTVAENRYNLMGKRDECRCSDPEFADRFLLD